MRSATARGSSRTTSGAGIAFDRSIIWRPSRLARASATSFSVAKPELGRPPAPSRRRGPSPARCSVSAASSCSGVSSPDSTRTSPSRCGPGCSWPPAAGPRRVRRPPGRTVVTLRCLGTPRRRALARSALIFGARPQDGAGTPGPGRRRAGRARSSSSRSRSSERTKSRVATSLQRDPQRGHLAGQVLGVGEGALGPLPVLLERDPVAVGLPVLREQDQRRGVRGLQAEQIRVSSV